MGGGSNDTVEIKIAYNSGAKTCYLTDTSIMSSILDLYNAGTQLVVTAPAELMGGNYVLNKVPVLRVTDNIYDSLSVNNPTTDDPATILSLDVSEQALTSRIIYLVLNKINNKNGFIVLGINKNVGNIFALQETDAETSMIEVPAFKLFTSADWLVIDQMASGWSSLSTLVKNYKNINTAEGSTAIINLEFGTVYTCLEPVGDIQFSRTGLALDDDVLKKEIVIKLYIADYVPTVSWPSSFIWPHRTPPVLEANTWYEINIAYVGNKWCGTYQSFKG